MPPDSALLEVAAHTDWDYEVNALHAAIFYVRYRLRREELLREPAVPGALYRPAFEEFSDGACWREVDCSSGRHYHVSLDPARFAEAFGEAYSLAVPFRKRWPGEAWRDQPETV